MYQQAVICSIYLNFLGSVPFCSPQSFQTCVIQKKKKKKPQLNQHSFNENILIHSLLKHFWSSEQNTLEQAERQICNKSWVKNPSARRSYLPECVSLQCDALPHLTTPPTSCSTPAPGSSMWLDSFALWANTFSNHTDANVMCVVCATGVSEIKRVLKRAREGGSVYEQNEFQGLTVKLKILSQWC